jgi:hypothetical protein
MSGNTGFGALGADEFDQLRKAIDGGYDVGGASQVGGGAWRLEFLEQTLAILTQQQRHIVFYTDLPKPPATSTAIEYARRTGLGDMQGGWYSSGELPLSHDAEYDRQVALVKFLGDVREIKMPFLLTKTLVDQRAETTQAGTLYLLSLLERTLFKGNAKLGVNGAEFEEIDGLETVVQRDAPATNIINLFGAPLEEGHVRNAGQVVVANYGFGTHVYAPSEICEDYSAAYLKHQFIPTPVAGGGGIAVGMAVDRIRTVGGDYQLRPLFLYKGLTREMPKTSAPVQAPAPAPTVAITGFTIATGGFWGNSLGLTGLGAGSSGTVEYKVAYANKYGETVAVVPSPASQAIAYADRAKKVRLTIVNPAGFTSVPTHLCIYRRDTAGDGTVSFPSGDGVNFNFGCVARVALASIAAGASQTWDDDGGNMPGTYRAWFGEMNQNVLHLSMLLPFTRIPLPALALAERFALVMFPSFIMRIPNRWVEFRNIGRRTT